MTLKLVAVNAVASSAVQETALSAPVALTDADAPVPDRLSAGPPDGPVISPVLVTAASFPTGSATRRPAPTGKMPWAMSPTTAMVWNGIPPMPMTDKVLAAPRAPMPSDEPSAASPLALMIAPVFEMGAVIWLMAPWVTAPKPGTGGLTKCELMPVMEVDDTAPPALVDTDAPVPSPPPPRSMVLVPVVGFETAALLFVLSA